MLATLGKWKFHLKGICLSHQRSKSSLAQPWRTLLHLCSVQPLFLCSSAARIGIFIALGPQSGSLKSWEESPVLYIHWTLSLINLSEHTNPKRVWYFGKANGVLQSQLRSSWICQLYIDAPAIGRDWSDIFGDQNNQARAVCARQESFLGECEQRGGEDVRFPLKGEPQKK